MGGDQGRGSVRDPYLHSPVLPVLRERNFDHDIEILFLFIFLIIPVLYGYEKYQNVFEDKNRV